MLIADARVATNRASRYLTQLCRHLGLVAREHPRMHAHAECADDHGVISFGQGRCTLHADQDVLVLRVEAPNVDCLRQLQQRIADRLERIGRRDRLTVAWTLPPRADEPPPTGSAENNERACT